MSPQAVVLPTPCAAGEGVLWPQAVSNEAPNKSVEVIAAGQMVDFLLKFFNDIYIVSERFGFLLLWYHSVPI